MSNKRVCQECGKEVEITFKFCPYCFTDFAEAEEQENLDAISSITPLNDDEEDGNVEAPVVDEEKIQDEDGNILFAGKYILIEPLRSSHSGTICKVRNTQDNATYIMKDLILDRKLQESNPNLHSELQDLLKKLSAVNAPSMNRIADFKVEKNRLYLFYETQENTPCIKYIQRRLGNWEAPTESELLNWFKQIISLVKFLHSDSENHYTAANLQPHAFVFTNNAKNIVYTHFGLPYIYEKLNIKDPFDPESGELNSDSLRSATYDLISIALLTYFLATGNNVKPENKESVNLFSVRDRIPKKLLFILQSLISLDPATETDSSFIEEIEMELTATPYVQGGGSAVIEEESSSSDNWEYYLGNKQRTNSIGNSGAPYFHLSWSIVMPEASIYFLQPHPDMIISLSDKGDLYEIEMERGSIIKKKNLNTSTVPPIIENGAIYINSASSQTALSIKTLATNWDVRTKSMFLSPPVIIGSKLYTVSYDGYMMSVDKNSGNPESMENINQKVIAPILYDENNLYIPSLSGNLLGINQETRVVDWVLAGKAPFTTAPAIYGEHIFAGDSSGRIISVNRETGIMHWETKIKGAIQHGPVIAHEKVLLTFATGKMVALDIKSGEIVWETELGNKNSATFCVSGHYIYLSSAENRLVSMNIDNGKCYNSVDLKVKICSTPLCVNGTVYIVTAGGELCAFTTRN